MKQKIILLTFLFLGAYLRLVNLPSRVPFDWDQERDMLTVEKMITEKKPTLVGPVVRGEGGFMLGPLYIYLLLPGYLVSQGNPISAPITNIAIDLGVGIGLFLLSPTAGIIWFLSPLVIAQSLIAWNVGLFPLWTLVLIYLYRKYAYKPSILLPSISLLSGFAWHIHASLIPISALFCVYLFWRHLKKITIKTIIFSGIAYFIPLSPLIIFDLRHDRVNLNLFLNFLKSSSTDKPESWIFVISETIRKFIEYLSGIVGETAKSVTGLLLLIIVLISHKKVNKDLLVINIFITVLSGVFLVIYRNPFFPNYYFSIILLPFMYLLGESLNSLSKFKLIPIVFLCILMLASDNYLISKLPPFSLRAKEELVTILKKENTTLDLRFELMPGRATGFTYLLDRQNVLVDYSSSTHVVVKDSASPPNKLNNREPDVFIPAAPYQVEIYRPYVLK